MSGKSSNLIVTLYKYVTPLGICSLSTIIFFVGVSLLGTLFLTKLMFFHSSSESFVLYSSLYDKDFSKYVFTKLSQLILAVEGNVPVFSISNSFVTVSPKFNVSSILVTKSLVSLKTNCIVPALIINSSFTVSPNDPRKYAYVPTIDMSIIAIIITPIIITLLFFFITIFSY